MRDIYLSSNEVSFCSWQESDTNAYADLVADPKVMRFISGGRTRDRATVAREVEIFNRELVTRGWSRWAVRVGPRAAFCGYCGFSETNHGIDFGQRYSRKYWGTTIPFIATHLVLAYGFEQLGFSRIYTMTHLANENALSINRKYLGIDRDYGEVCETVHGPHLKIDVDHAMFLEARDRNDQLFRRFAKRLAERMGA